jgi:hypothetical protein
LFWQSESDVQAPHVPPSPPEPLDDPLDEPLDPPLELLEKPELPPLEPPDPELLPVPELPPLDEPEPPSGVSNPPVEESPEPHAATMATENT